MGELLKTSFCDNRFCCESYTYGNSRYDRVVYSWPLSGSLSFRLATQTRECGRNEVVLGRRNVRKTIPRKHSRVWSIPVRCSMYGLHTSTRIESEADDGFKLLDRGNRSSEAFNPTWGNSSVEQGTDFEPNYDNGLGEGSACSMLENRYRLHFLEETDEITLSGRLLALSRSNRIRSAMELFGSMKFSGLKPNAHSCNSLLSCLLRNKRFDDAMRVFAFMRTERITTGHSCSLLLKGIVNSKGFDSALEMFAEFEKDDKLKEDIDAVLYNTVIAIFGRMNDSFGAERLWRSMKENGIIGTDITYSLLISIFVRNGRNELGIDAYDEMIHNGLKPREDAMHAMISACTKEGRWDLAVKVLENMIDYGFKPSLIACNAVIYSLGKASEIELAFQVYGITKTLGHKIDGYTWNALLTSLYQGKRYMDVLQLIGVIRAEGLSKLNEHMYHTCLISCQKLGSWEKALKLLWEMEASDLSITASMYNLVIGACETARKPRVAIQVYKRMIHRNCNPDVFTHLSLIRSCIWGSLWVEVNEILEKVPPDASLYNAAIHGMCLRRQTKSAKKLYQKMREIGLMPDGKTRALMLQFLPRG